MHIQSALNAMPMLFLVGALMMPPGISAAGTPPDATVVPLLTEQLADIPGKELDMITVEYPPGGSSPPHRHDAYVLVYVLEGAVEMQVKGQNLVTVKAGESFIERPSDIHAVSRNASKSAPAKFLVVFLKATAKPSTRAVP